MKKLLTIFNVLFISQISSASQICSMQPRMYIPKAWTQVAVGPKKSFEANDWQDCYKSAVGLARLYKIKEKANIDVKIFGLKSSEGPAYVYVLVDWKIETPWYKTSPKGTVNSMSPSEPTTGMQAMDDDGSQLFR